LMLAANAVAQVTFNVDSILDQIDDNTLDGICHTAAGNCTLRAAIMQANKINVDVTINLPTGNYVLTIAPTGGDAGASGGLEMTFPLIGDPTISIVGAGRAATIVDGNQLDGVLLVGDFRTAILSRLTIRNGVRSNSDGGGITNNGTLTLTDVIISGNQALYGAGISSHSNGDLTIQDSTIVGNHATDTGGGGGIHYTGAGVLNIARSTISDNTAVSGGGIWNDGLMFVINSTIAGNKATSAGGGIYSYATARLNANIYNSTIAYNTAAEGTSQIAQGGGVYLDTSGTEGNGFNVYNTILANNLTGISYNDCTGGASLKTHARNLFRNLFTCSIDEISGSYDYLDPNTSLGPLQNNGGPTQTIALLAGSNAIDGTIVGVGCRDSQSAPIAVDQRGFARGADSACDVGAYEYNDIFANGFE